MSRVVVAGAGESGLRCAQFMADAGLDVSLVERLPAPGGQEPEHTTREFAASVEESGAKFILGTLAVDFSANVLRILGVEGPALIPCDVLVVATGTRPATRGELRVGGDRCAGVLPGSAMVHLLEAGVLPGYHPVVYGTGPLALHCADLLERAGAAAVTLVGSERPSGDVRPQVGLFVPYELEAIHGKSRVTNVSIRKTGSGRSVDVLADAVILTAGGRPMRNIEGAITDAPGVVFCQATTPGTDPASIARRAAEEVFALTQGFSPHQDMDTDKENIELWKH